MWYIRKGEGFGENLKDEKDQWQDQSLWSLLNLIVKYENFLDL